MPNDCYNTMIIKSQHSEILDDLIQSEFGHFLNENYTSNDNDKFYIYRRGDYGINFKLYSKWVADFEWLEGLIVKYPDIWVKNIWLSEDGSAGIWIGTMNNGEKDIKRLDWLDMSIEEEMYVFSNW